MPVETRLSPINYRQAIVDKEGRPTNFFGQQWNALIDRNSEADSDLTDLDSVAAAVTVLQSDVDALENVDIVAGVGLTGGGALSAGNVTLDLEDTGAVAGTYGSSTEIPVITVDAQGRITSISTVTAA